jgi:hypothetical protein
MEGNFNEIFVMAGFTPSGHDETKTRGVTDSVNSAMWITLFPAWFLDPQKQIYCLFNPPNELQPLFGSSHLSLCFPKLEQRTQALKVGWLCCESDSSVNLFVYGWAVQ